MFSGMKFVRFVRNGAQAGSQVPSSAWWLVMAPGLLLVFMALAILVWPELLAYMVAFAILFAGGALTVWGWSLRQIEKRMKRTSRNGVNGHGPNGHGPNGHGPNGTTGANGYREDPSETVIYYER